MDSMTETQVKPPRPSRRTPIPSDWSDDDGKDDQARAPIAKPVPQDPQPSTSFGTYARKTLRRPNTYPKVLTFGRGKLAPLASGTGITRTQIQNLYRPNSPSKRTHYSSCPFITRQNCLQ